MKKLILLLLIPEFVFSELILEITEGSENPLSLIHI